MKRITTVLACGITSVALLQNASGQILVNDNFDSYADQAAFLAAWPVVGTQPSGILVSTQAVSFANSVSINTGTATADSQRNGRIFTESGVPSAFSSITFSFDFYDATGTGNPHRSYANLQDTTAPSASGQLISMGLNNNLLAAAQDGNFYMARILGGSANGGAVSVYFKLNDAGAPLRSLGWHNLAVTISDVSFAFYVDGILSETVANSLTLRSYDNVRIGAGVTSLAPSWFDNVRVEVIPVPEPSIIALGLLGGLGLMFGMARRRAR